MAGRKRSALQSNVDACCNHGAAAQNEAEHKGVRQAEAGGQGLRLGEYDGGEVVVDDAAETAEEDEREWEEGNEWQAAGFGCVADEPLYLYLGDNPSIALTPIGSGNGSSAASSGSPMSSVAFLLTQDSGYCPNSEINNKRADRGVCDMLPSFCEGSSVMNYAYGSLQALQLLLQQNKPLSPCHPSIVSWCLAV